MTPESGQARLRIVSASAKVVYVFVATLVVVPVFVAATAALGSWAGALSSVPLNLIIVGYAARNFRDAGIESLDAPREWWRMTARPTSGFVFGAVFLAQALWVAVTAFQRPDSWALLLGAATEALLAVLFFWSSSKLIGGSTGEPGDVRTA